MEINIMKALIALQIFFLHQTPLDNPLKRLTVVFKKNVNHRKAEPKQ